ncbi:MAG: zeta toxin family protein [Alphaproteobacteria bacterium]|nr:zeta toxin family protein [Alphaproteobacteria bacterium]
MLRLVENAAAEAGKRAARTNDKMGLRTPVVSDGEVRYVLGEHLPISPAPLRVRTPVPCGTPNWMWIIAGPNGAGKTTFTEEFISQLRLVDLVALNADDRTRKLRPEHPDMKLDEVNKMAADQIDAEVLDCIRSNRTFVIETVGSTSKYEEAVDLAKKNGYGVGLVYCSLGLPELSPKRVALRVSKGGHDVDPVKAVARYYRSHAQAVSFWKKADTVFAIDNSAAHRMPVVVAAKLVGHELLYRHPNVNPALDGLIAIVGKSSAAKLSNG